MQILRAAVLFAIGAVFASPAAATKLRSAQMERDCRGADSHECDKCMDFCHMGLDTCMDRSQDGRMCSSQWMPMCMMTCRDRVCC